MSVAYRRVVKSSLFLFSVIVISSVNANTTLLSNIDQPVLTNSNININNWPAFQFIAGSSANIDTVVLRGHTGGNGFTTYSPETTFIRFYMDNAGNVGDGLGGSSVIGDVAVIPYASNDGQFATFTGETVVIPESGTYWFALTQTGDFLNQELTMSADFEGEEDWNSTYNRAQSSNQGASYNLQHDFFDYTAIYQLVGAQLSNNSSIDFTAYSLPANASAVASAIQPIFAEDAELLGAFRSIDPAEYEQALETLKPEIISTNNQSATETYQRSMATIATRLLSLRSQHYDLPYVAAGDEYEDSNVWFQGFGKWISQHSRNGISGYRSNLAGFTMGADKEIIAHLNLGIAFTYSKIDVRQKTKRNQTDTHHYQASVYGSYDFKKWSADATVSYGVNQYDTRRYIDIGTLHRIANANYHSQEWGVRGRATRDFNMDAHSWWSPYIELYYLRLKLKKYSETGAGTANLTVTGAHYDDMQSSAGISVRREIPQTNKLKIIPELHVAWRHAYKTNQYISSASFEGGGASFQTHGLVPAKDSLNVGINLGFYVRSNLDLSMQYDFEVKEDYTSHFAMLRLKYAFG